MKYLKYLNLSYKQKRNFLIFFFLLLFFQLNPRGARAKLTHSIFLCFFFSVFQVSIFLSVNLQFTIVRSDLSLHLFLRVFVSLISALCVSIIHVFPFIPFSVTLSIKPSLFLSFFLSQTQNVLISDKSLCVVTLGGSFVYKIPHRAQTQS